jgi:hypothetical protein
MIAYCIGVGCDLLRQKRAAKAKREDQKRLLAKLQDLESSEPKLQPFFSVCSMCVNELESSPWNGTPIGGPVDGPRMALMAINDGRCDFEQITAFVRMISNPKHGVDIRTRTHRLRKHKDCFVGKLYTLIQTQYERE